MDYRCSNHTTGASSFDVASDENFTQRFVCQSVPPRFQIFICCVRMPLLLVNLPSKSQLPRETGSDGLSRRSGSFGTVQGLIFSANYPSVSGSRQGPHRNSSGTPASALHILACITRKFVFFPGDFYYLTETHNGLFQVYGYVAESGRLLLSGIVTDVF